MVIDDLGNGHDEGTDDVEDRPSPSISSAEVIEEIRAGVDSIPSERLSALSEPSDDTVSEFVSMWPLLNVDRKRYVLSTLHKVAEEDATLDFHRIHLSALRDQDAESRILAIRGLWEQERADYMNLLIDQLRDDSEASVRSVVAEALGRWVVGAEFGLLSDDDVDHLSSALREVAEDLDEEDEVRGCALEALGARSEEWVEEVIGEMYEAGTHRMRLAALRAMGRNANDEWLAVLIYCFDDEDPEIRAAAATSAGQLLLESAIDPLTLLMEDDDDAVQIAAIYAVGEIAGPDSERVLTALLGRPERHLAEAAQSALDGVRMLATDFAEQPEIDS